MCGLLNVDFGGENPPDDVHMFSVTGETQNSHVSQLVIILLG